MTRRAAKDHGATFVEDEPTEIDKLSHELYPGIFNSNRRRLRKLQALALPLDEVAYVDVDVILFVILRRSLAASRQARQNLLSLRQALNMSITHAAITMTSSRRSYCLMTASGSRRINI
jgi:hypothetical protein